MRLEGVGAYCFQVSPLATLKDSYILNAYKFNSEFFKKSMLPCSEQNFTIKFVYAIESFKVAEGAKYKYKDGMEKEKKKSCKWFRNK